MIAESKLSRLILVSPWTLLLFLIIPLLVILSVTLHLHLPLAGSHQPLLVNNICLAVLVGCRLLRYLAGLRRSFRYGADWRKPRQSVMIPAPVADVRMQLEKGGYSCAAEGCYCEKHDLGYLGTTLMYAGLLILLSVGCWDNLRQFSGVLLDGIGPASSLNKSESYLRINKGPLAASPSSLPRMQITSQSLPDSTYPKGATDVTLIADDGKMRNVRLVPGVPVTCGDFDISMSKLVFQPQLVIKDKDSGVTLFDGLVTLDPLVQRRGVFSFYGLFQGAILGGGAYYQPEQNMLMLVISRGNEKVVTELAFQVDQQAVKGDYILSCAKMGQWSEIHVIHRRHKGLLVLGGIIAIFGLLLRIAIRPRRVWLEETTEGCAIRLSDKAAVNLLKTKD